MEYLEELAIDGNPLTVNRKTYIEFMKTNFLNLKVLDHKEFMSLDKNDEIDNVNIKAEISCDFVEKEKTNFEPKKPGLKKNFFISEIIEANKD